MANGDNNDIRDMKAIRDSRRAPGICQRAHSASQRAPSASQRATAAYRRIAETLLARGEKLFGGECMSFAQICQLVWPLFLDQLFVQVINMANTGMVASYGAEAVSAVSTVGSFNQFIMALIMAIATGCAVVVAQYCGRGDRPAAYRAAAQAVTSSVLLSVLIGAVLVAFADPFIRLLIGSPEGLEPEAAAQIERIAEYGRVFFVGNAVSYPFFGVVQVVLSALRGSGATKTSIFFSTGLSLANILLNVVFLMILPMGVLGLSIACVASRALLAVVSVLYMLYPRGRIPTAASSFLAVNLGLQRSILVIAIPAGLEQVFFHGGRIITQVVIMRFGAMSAMANGIVMPFSNLLQVTGFALQLALVTIAGQCVGMGKPNEAKRYIRLITYTCMATIGATCLLSIPLLHPFLGLYNMPPDAYEKAYNATLIVILGSPVLWSISFVSPSGLRAGGDVMFTTVVALVTMWTVRVALGYALGVYFGLDLYGIWLAMLVEWGIRGTLFLLRARGDKWYRHKVI